MTRAERRTHCREEIHKRQPYGVILRVGGDIAPKDDAIKKRAKNTMATITQSIEAQQIRKERLEAKLAGAATPRAEQTPTPSPAPQ